VVTASAVSTVGFMVLLDVPFSITFNILPAFLFVVGVCDSVHILMIAYQRMAAGDSKEQAIVEALRHSGLAVLMTSVTTACGLLSFSFAEVQPIADLGIIAPIGVMLAMLYTLVLMPALMMIFPVRTRVPAQGAARKALVDRFLARVGDVATSHPWPIVGLTALLLLLGLGGLVQVRFSHNGLHWFPEHDPMRVAAELFDDEFNGASKVEVLIHTGRENGLHDPVTLARLEDAMRRSEALEVDGRPVAKAISIVDVVKEIHQALNENRPEYYALPQERKLVAQELLLFENSGSDDLTEVTDSGFETARMTVRTPWVDAMLYPPFLELLGEELREALGEEVELEMTGGAVLFTRVFRGVIVSMARSYIFAFAVIIPILVMLVGDLRRGLVAVIPNLIPIYMVLSLMGWVGIPIDVSTLLIGGIVLGLAVDDTIHFMHKFNRYYEESGDARRAVHETLATTGSALLFTSLVLATGFSVFLAAYLNNVRWFGLLASFATIVAFLADVVVAPALMVLVCGRAEKRGRPRIP
jgi:predicted RND superfamily exporter protein